MTYKLPLIPLSLVSAAESHLAYVFVRVSAAGGGVWSAYVDLCLHCKYFKKECEGGS